MKFAQKTVALSIDLTFSKIVECFKSNEIQSEDLKIDIGTQFGDAPTSLALKLANTFSLVDLPLNEWVCLEILSILPSEFLVEDYILVYSKQTYDTNKVSIANTLNSLHTKGWIHRDAGVIRIHQIVQLAVRSQIKNFVGHALFINFLCHRLNENNQAFVHTSSGFVHMAESILAAIPKKDREGIIQPLILLELNLLESHRQRGDDDRFINPMKELTSYAEKVLGSQSRDIAIVFNNASIAYFMAGEYESAKAYVTRSINILDTLEAEDYRYLINALDNLCAMLLSHGGNPENATELMTRSVELRKKYIAHDDAMFASQLNNFAALYLRLNMFDESIKALKLAILIHENSKWGQNNLNLAMYHCNLAVSYFLKNDIDKAALHQIKSIQILEKTGSKNKAIRECYAIMSSILKAKGDEQGAERFRTKYLEFSNR